MLQVEIRPGILHDVQQHIPGKSKQQQQQAAHPAAANAGPGRPSQHKPQQHQAGQVANLGKPYEHPTAELAPELAALEDKMRDALKHRAAVHVKERTVLLRAFGKVGRHRVCNKTELPAVVLEPMANEQDVVAKPFGDEQLGSISTAC